MRVHCRLLTCAFLALVASFAHSQVSTPVTGWKLTDAASTKATGEAISKPDFDTEDWTKAVVPGTVLTSLVEAGRYPEPLFGLNNLQIPESLCRTGYWYRAQVNIPAKNRGRHTWIRFNGVNYSAEVWVNGRDAGKIAGTFIRGVFDISGFVIPGKPSVVAVKINPPAHPSVPDEQTLKTGTGPNGGAMGADGATFVATVGWDWIPGIRDRDMGIWQNVEIFSTGDVTIHDPYVVAKFPKPGDYKHTALDVSAYLQNETDKTMKGVLIGNIEGSGIKFKVPLPHGVAPHSRFLAHANDLVLNNPKLWWPNGYGKQDLYRLKLRFEEGKKESDSSETDFGIREIKYFKDEGFDSTKNPERQMLIQVNGVPVMCRGGNWGMDEAMKRSPYDRLDAQLRLHHDANCTMVRNWVGQATQEDFYKACDKYGILIWDDFWLANPSDGPVPLDNKLFLQNALEKILRFRNHPSICVWCGRNEGFPPKEIEAGLENYTQEYDGTRFYQPHSSSTNGVTGGGPYSNSPFQRYFDFTGSMHTEIGAPSIPTIESVEGMMPKKDWWPINDDWAYHDLCKGAQGGDRYPTLLAHRFGSVSGFKDFIRKGAMMTFETYREMFEGRNSKLFAPAAGVMLWMSNPSQPSFVWQLYHHDLDPTAAMFGTKLACEKIHVQQNPNGDIQVINLAENPLSNYKVVRTTFSVTGVRAGEEKLAVDAKPFAATTIAHKDSAPITRLQLFDARGRQVSENFYWGTLEGRDDVSFLQSLPQVTLMGSTSPIDGGVRVTLRNSSNTIAVLAHLSLRHSDGSRVLPAFYSDNYINLFPGETRTIEIEGENLGPAPYVAIDGWNVSATGNGIRTNEEAKPEPPLPPAAPRPVIPGTVLSIDCGGPDVDGSPWNPDDLYASGGSPNSFNEEVSGSDLPQDVLKTERYGDMIYTIPLPEGNYKVRLIFAETSQPKVGGRIFSVSIGRMRVLTDFDIFAEAGGVNKAVVKEFPAATDRNGNIAISFRHGSANEPEIRAIQILKA